ncbi:hypothetical protein F4779DRAFT_591196 [Xylariaceae sp. FL0662B]|nr:hypothetical protein F4779DRAFT_591196 [Xylariaceae sp. FL0662B]
MADAAGPDKSLLERLNALKPSTVSLDPSSKSVPASTIEPAKPLSREDALSERLKSLRDQSSTGSVATSNSHVNREDGDNIALSSTMRSAQPHTSPKGSLDTGIGAPKVPTDYTPDDIDPLLHTDDQTLEELLADLESDQQWLNEVAAEEEEHQRVSALLEELGKDSKAEPNRESNETIKVDHDVDESSSDDSEGDRMTREADSILTQVDDETEWEKANEPPQPEHASPSPAHEANPKSPGDAANQPLTSKGASESDPFSLPTVPSDLQDQADLSESSQEEADFEAFMASRMAALKVSTPPGPTLPSAPTTEVDALGLPVVPTFAPADRPAPGLVKRVGYTDEDQKTWCIVCLEDGAIRCLGCDGDVYCARCWKEMHVGPRAGYDERGHRWETFTKARQ